MCFFYDRRDFNSNDLKPIYFWLHTVIFNQIIPSKSYTTSIFFCIVILCDSITEANIKNRKKECFFVLLTVVIYLFLSNLYFQFEYEKVLNSIHYTNLICKFLIISKYLQCSREVSPLYKPCLLFFVLRHHNHLLFHIFITNKLCDKKKHNLKKMYINY